MVIQSQVVCLKYIYRKKKSNGLSRVPMYIYICKYVYMYVCACVCTIIIKEEAISLRGIGAWERFDG